MKTRHRYRPAKLIMVMGVQRSGTNALVQSLGQDPNIRVENETDLGLFYDNYYIKPESEIGPIIRGIRRRILFKPITDTFVRSIDDVINEFYAHGVVVAWIFRDPVDVWQSTHSFMKVPNAELDSWVATWNARNQYVLDSLRGPHRDRIAVVSYGDLIQCRETYNDLCNFLDIEPRNNTFWMKDAKKGHRALPDEVQDRIRTQTAKMIDALHAVRLTATSSRPKPSEHSSMQQNVNRDYDMPTELCHKLPPLRTEIVVERVGTTSIPAWLVEPILVPANQEYFLTCQVRSKDHHAISIGLATADKPDFLLASIDGETTSTWQTFILPFVARTTTEDIRVVFATEAPEANIEIRGMTFQPLIENASAENDSMSADSLIRIVSTRVAPVDRNIQSQVTEPGDTSTAPTESMLWKTVRHDDLDSTSTKAILTILLGNGDFALEVSHPSANADRYSFHRLLLHAGCHADLRASDSSQVTSVKIVSCSKRKPHSVRLVTKRMVFAGGERYSLSFKARSERPRPVRVSAVQDHLPWKVVGSDGYGSFEINEQWRSFRCEFVADFDEHQAVVCVDLGESDVPACFTDVTVCRIDDHMALSEDQVALSSFSGDSAVLSARDRTRMSSHDWQCILQRTKRE